MKYLLFCFLLLSNNAFSNDFLNLEDSDIIIEDKQEQINDPYQKYNKIIYNFNINYYKKLNPFLTWYETWPIEIRWTIKTTSSHYNNQIFYMFYNLLDGDLEGFLLSFWKFYINTIFGIGGLYDIADRLEIPLAEKNLDDILYKLGTENPSYFILPISGAGTVFKACSFLIENTYRILSGLPLFLHVLNLPNQISEDITFTTMSGDFSTYETYKKTFFARYKNEREKNLKHRNSRLKLTNPCDNKNTLEPCIFEDDVVS